MELNTIVILVLVVIIMIFLFVTRCIPYLFSLWVQYWHQTKIRIRRINIWRLSFDDVSVEKALFSIKIERLGLTSSLVCQDERKLIVLKLCDVRIEVKKSECPKVTPRKVSKGSSAKLTESENDNLLSKIEKCDTFKGSVLASKTFKIHPAIVTLIQFFAVRLNGVNIVCLLNALPACLIHCSMEKLDVEAATLNQTNIALTISAETCDTKILKHASQRTVAPCDSSSTKKTSCKWNSEKLKDLLLSSSSQTLTNLNDLHASQQEVPDWPLLLRSTFSFGLYTEFNAGQDLTSEVLRLELKEPHILVYDRLFSTINGLSKTELSETVCANSSSSESCSIPPCFTYSEIHPTNAKLSEEGEAAENSSVIDESSFYSAYPSAVATLAHYWLLMPLVTHLSIERASFSIIGSAVTDQLESSAGKVLHTTASLIEANLQVPRSSHTFQVSPPLLPCMLLKLSVNASSLTTSHQTAIILNKLQLYVQHFERQLGVEVELYSFSCWHDYRDLKVLLSGVSSLQTADKRNNAAAVKKNVSIRNLGRALRRSINSSALVIGIWDIGLGVQLPEGPPLFTSLHHCSLDTDSGLFIVESLTSRLGKECCCERSYESVCFCHTPGSGRSGRCSYSRLSGCDFEEIRNRSNESDEDAESRRSSSSETQQSTRSKYGSLNAFDFLGNFGKEEYINGISGNNVSDSRFKLVQIAPVEQLELLAEQRGGNFRQQHVFGTPLAIGLCHIQLIRLRSSDHFSSVSCDRTSLAGSTYGPAYRGDMIKDQFNCLSGFNRSFLSFSSSTNSSTSYHGYLRHRWGSGVPSHDSSIYSSHANLTRSTTRSTCGCIGPEHVCQGSTSSVPDEEAGVDGFPKAVIEIDHTQLEWSPPLIRFICAVKSYASDLLEFFNCKSGEDETKVESKFSSTKIQPVALENITFYCNNINLFAHTDFDASLMVRIDEVRSLRPCAASMTGLVLQHFLPEPRPFICVTAASTKTGSTVLELGTLSVVLVQDSNETLVEVQEHCRLSWTASAHLTFLVFLKDILALKTLFKNQIANVVHDVRPEAVGAASGSGDPCLNNGLQLQVLVKSEIQAKIEVSSRHEAVLKCHGFTFLTARGLTCLMANKLVINFEDHQIMELLSIKLSSSYNNSELRAERAEFSALSLPINEAWKLNLASWRITFPYNYNFDEAFNEDFISLVKWLRKVHNTVLRSKSHVKNLPYYAETAKQFSNEEAFVPRSDSHPPLAPDVILKVDKFYVSLQDDPFEVKLRYNYELMEDEYKESCKRKKALNSRIQELQFSGGYLTPSQIEDLQRSLKEKDSETYIKRSKLMYEKTSPRAELFTWEMERVVIFALADPTMNGTKNIVEKLQSIDTATSVPAGYKFSTLWCRFISGFVGQWQFVLRDYPQPLLKVDDFACCGPLILAEQSTNKRGERTVTIELPHPWHNGEVVRYLAPRKFYHDFTCEAKNFTLAYGPCWELAVTQFNIVFSMINKPSLDPSLPLPWWDKVRLLLHGRFLLLAEHFTLKLHASLDPYNTTEEMELAWSDLTLNWTNATLDFVGDLNVFVRTASKYDDARLLSIPNLTISLKLHWICHGNPDDHHSVMLCAPDKLPEYSSNQEHDSYRVFRSKCLQMNVNFENKPIVTDNAKYNSGIEILFYGSTLRWFENLKMILSGVTRPIRRGTVFGNVAPRKPQLSRHYRSIHLALTLQRFDVRYWLSAGVKKGFRLSSDCFYLSSEYSLSLQPRNTGLVQRSLARWTTVYLNAELRQAQLWLQSVFFPSEDDADVSSDSAGSKCSDGSNVSGKKSSDGKRSSDTKKQQDVNENLQLVTKKPSESKKNLLAKDESDGSDKNMAAQDVGGSEFSPSESDNGVKRQKSAAPQVEKFYFLHVTKVEYKHELQTEHPYISASSPESAIHRLIVHQLKGAWTTDNRDIVLTLFDSWIKSQQLKQNLCHDILNTYDSAAAEGSGMTPNKAQLGGRFRQNKLPGHCGNTGVGNGSDGLTPPLQVSSNLEATPSPMTRWQVIGGAELLQQLIKEADNNFVAYSEDCSNSSEQPRDPTLLCGIADCTTDDVVYKRWLIQLVNSQVLLKGCDTEGYVIISAAKSEIEQRVHRPVWRQQTLNTKTTWYGSLECMQYYATVSPSKRDMQMANILWLSVANIEERIDAQHPVDYTDIVGSTQSAGGVVTTTVGPALLDNKGCAHTQDIQLQRIVSRCRCEFYYVNYGELGLEPELLGEVPPPPLPTDELWGDHRDPTDTFTLMHHDLCISTNSLQYNMVVDILNKLLLYVDPVKKAASSALARMRFQLQLSSGDDQRKPIIKLQNQLRNIMSQLRSLEKELFLLQKAMDRDTNLQLYEERDALALQVTTCKERQSALSQELAIRIHLYNETQLRANHKLAAAQGDKVIAIRINEVFFRKAQWRLTEEDGQLAIAEVALSNFLYTKKTNSDDSGEHLLELGYVNMKNLLPNQAYSDVFAPTTLNSTCALDRQKTLRIFCREKPPCGGITVIDHFEINVVPLDISLTYQFYKTIMKFCFPETRVPMDEGGRGSGIKGGRRHAVRRSGGGYRNTKETQFYVQLQNDDVEIMKQRAEHNKMFVYVKIPELKVRLSYKGLKEKNITDVTNFRLVVPSMEAHNVTWTWLDFLNSLKEHCKSALLPQVIKIKLNVVHKASDSTAELDEDEKARLLLGDRHLPPGGRASKRGFFKLKK